MEVRAQALGQEPCGNVEVLVVGFGEVFAPCAGFVESGGLVGDAVARGKRSPGTSDQVVILCGNGCHLASGFSGNISLPKSVLIDVMPFPCSIGHLKVSVNVEPQHSLFAGIIRHYDPRVVVSVLHYTVLLL